MKQISVIIFVKEREPGLLSIAENREKSLVPVFNGKKIIDFYLTPLHFNVFSRISVLTDRDHIGVKDYIIYAYSTQGIRLIDKPDILRTLVNALKLRKNEYVLILRADSMWLPDWFGVKNFLLDLPTGNYEIECSGGHSLGFFLHSAKGVQSVLKEESEIRNRGSKIDTAWEILTKTLRKSVKKVKLNSLCLNVHTVYDYYSAHFSILHALEKLIHILPPSPAKGDEEPARITGNGFVKNSFISSSCIIEGYVEHSILFSHVRVGKGAKVLNSVIMDNNYIGGGALVQNAVVCDGGELFSRVTPNIGEDARIGEDDTRGVNSRYPKYIYGGITLIGQNVEVPKGLRVARNCFIATGVNKSTLRGLERIKAGDSVLQE